MENYEKHERIMQIRIIKKSEMWWRNSGEFWCLINGFRNFTMICQEIICFLCFVSVLGIYKFLYICALMFPLFWKNYSRYFFKYCFYLSIFFLLPFWDFNYTYLRFFTMSHTHTLICKYDVHFRILKYVGIFYQCTFRVTYSFSAMSNLLLNPCFQF